MDPLTKKSAIILDGQKLADDIKADLKQKISRMAEPPGLAAVLVGDDPGSALYIKLKEKACHEVGITFHKYLSTAECYPDISEPDLLSLIEFLNHDPHTSGIIVQLPLPDTYDTQKIINALSPTKDVDGFHPANKNSAIAPPTIAAVMELLKATDQALTNKKTLIIGNSNIFIDGLEYYLKQLGISSVIGSRLIPPDANDYDIIIIALGQAQALKKSMVKPGAIVIDVGINKVNGRTVGDADENVRDVAGYVSPVPGGVGPLTVAYLLYNTYQMASVNNASVARS